MWVIIPRQNDNLQLIPQKYENLNLAPIFIQKMQANGDALMMFFTFLSVSECKLMFSNFRGEEERLSF